jgi:hypothetical protein
MSSRFSVTAPRSVNVRSNPALSAVFTLSV